MRGIVELYRGDEIMKPWEGEPTAAVYDEAYEEMAGNPSQLLLVAEEEGRVIGTVQVTYVRHLMLSGVRIGIVEAMFVSPKAAGKGVGTALIDAVKEEALKHGCGMLELTSNKLRERAHAFYEKQGFRRTHEGFKLRLV